MRSPSRALRWTALASALAGGPSACAREQVEVAESEERGGDVGLADTDAPPMFPSTDAGASFDGGACGEAPLIGVCADCPNGYVIVDGESTCTCCE
jgi:hypothetical protein